jgi:hexosaminidase
MGEEAKREISYRLTQVSARSERRTQLAPRLSRALGRYNAVLQGVAALGGAPGVDVSVVVASTDEELVGASAAYTVTAEGSTVTEAADTFVGAAYAMESVVQLVRVHGGLPAVRIDDAPLLAWRGLMLDAGRRFFPVPLVHNILDTMAASKLNVLHWHLADNCRWAVDSALFPAVTSNLTGVYAGSYSAADVADVIAYAGDRGIRVVPEFDTPGHSHGLLALGDNGQVVFCDPADASRSQLYGDPRNVTYATIAALYAEMAGLFADPVFHIGADETGVVGPCTTESTFALERALLGAVTAANKTPAGWEELLFDAGAATPGSVVYAWNR